MPCSLALQAFSDQHLNVLRCGHIVAASKLFEHGFILICSNETYGCLHNGHLQKLLFESKRMYKYLFGGCQVISIHTTHFNGSNASHYKFQWIIPWHPEVKYRGNFITPLKVETMSDIASLIKQYVWSPIIWDPLVRLEINFKACGYCVYDFDGNLKLDEALKHFSNFTHIIGTTRRHTKEKNRFRVVVPFDEVISDLDTYKFNMRKTVEFWKNDPKCVDGARYFFPCKEIISINEKGNAQGIFPYVEHPKPKFTGEINKNSSRKMKLLTQFGANVEGERNSTVYGVCIDMTLKGFTPNEMYNFIAPYTNLPESEIKSCIKSAYNYFSKIRQEQT